MGLLNLLGIMSTVELSLKNESGESVETISATFTPDDIRLFHSFVDLLSRVRTCTLLERGMPAVTNMSWKSGSNMTFTCVPYSNAELHELLHVLRPVMLQREPASFHNIASLLSRRFASKNFAGHIKMLRKVFDHGELSLYMQISINDQPLLHESLLDTWLNGAQYHTDADKAAAWRSLEASLTTENARALVMSQLHSKVKVLFNVEYIVNLILQKSSNA